MKKTVNGGKAGTAKTVSKYLVLPQGEAPDPTDEAVMRFLSEIHPSSTLFVRFKQNIKLGELPDTPWGKDQNINNIVFLWDACPLDPDVLLTWRNTLIDSGFHFQVLHISKKAPESVGDLLREYISPAPEKEQGNFEVGSTVAINRDIKGTAVSDPSLFTVASSTKMMRQLDELDYVRKTYASLVGDKVEQGRESILRAVNRLIDFDPNSVKAGSAGGDDALRKAMKSLSADIEREITKQNLDINVGKLPKVLLLGESGSGKTMVARYLASRLGFGASPKQGGASLKRISMPEFTNKEDDFEYAIFGYRRGAFTGADIGHPGVLLEHLGGVVFFDEIGDASPITQAKLLGYLDDYNVTPKGWAGAPIFCPTLVIAATNQPVRQWAEQSADSSGAGRYFRNDLLMRFNVIIDIPSLNDRKEEEFEKHVDSMLQMDTFYPLALDRPKKIQYVGASAMQMMKAIDYKGGNFRILETLIRFLCKYASENGRDYIVSADVEKARRSLGLL